MVIHDLLVMLVVRNSIITGSLVKRKRI